MLTDNTQTTKSFQLHWMVDLHPIGPENNPESRLLGSVEILGASHHVNLEEVTLEEDSQVSVLCNEEDTFLPQIWDIAQGGCETVAINNRTYVVLITPFGR